MADRQSLDTRYGTQDRTRYVVDSDVESVSMLETRRRKAG